MSGRRISVLVPILAALLVTSVAPAHAYHRDRQRELERLIEQKRQQIAAAESKERNLLAQIQASDERRAALHRQIVAIADELSQALTRLAAVEARLDSVSAELRDKTRLLESTLAALDEQTKLLTTRVQHLYMDSAATLAVSLEMARDFNDFVAASEYQSAIARTNMAVVQRIETTKDEIERQRADIESKQAALEIDRREAKAEADRIAGIRARRAAAEAAVAREIATRESLLAQVRDQKAAYRRALASYVRESENIAAFLRGAQSGQTAIQGQGGYLRWPVSGRITSPYGWRTHPVYGYRSFHSGIDIGAGHGTTVKSARRGTVIYTGYKGAYGLIVIVDHGNALATLYAHLSSTYVRSGEQVSTLEPIAAVGSTGWSTGPHLHFEVRVNGEHQNPMNWL